MDGSVLDSGFLSPFQRFHTLEENVKTQVILFVLEICFNVKLLPLKRVTY